VGYSWKVNGVQSGTTPLGFTHTFVGPAQGASAPLVYTVSLIATAATGCTDTAISTITVYPDPLATFTLAANAGCILDPIVVVNTSQAAGIYQWFLDGSLVSISATPSLVFPAPAGLHTLRLIAENVQGCRPDTFVLPLTTWPKPIAAFLPDTAADCGPLSVSFTNQSTGATSYLWDFGDGTTSTAFAPTHLFAKPYLLLDSLFNVTLYVTNVNGCMDTAYGQVRVRYEPRAALVSSPSDGCGPLKVTLDPTTTQGSVSYTLDYGDGSAPVSGTTLQTHLHTYAPQVAGSGLDVSYTARFIAQTAFGCADTAYTTITVHPRPLMAWTNTNACEGQSVQFTEQAQGETSYLWQFGDGNTSTLPNPTHTYFHNSLSDTTFTVSLIATTNFGCADTLTKSVTVYGTPMAAFLASDTLSCSGALTVQFTELAQAETGWQWDFGDGTQSTQPNPLHVFGPGDFTVMLIAINGNGCSDTAYKQIQVARPVQALFGANRAEACTGLPVTFTNLSQNGVTYLWSFGDGTQSTAFEPTHRYGYQGSPFTVTLVAYGDFGCSDTFVMPNMIRVVEPPIAAIHVDTPIVYQPDMTFSFFSHSQADSLIAWEWSFGDGSPLAFQENETHTYKDTGDYMVRLIVTNQQGCTDTAYQWVRVQYVAGSLFVPNAFMPGIDGPYDVTHWLPKGQNITKYHLWIFDEWGRVVFESTSLDANGSPDEGWDGSLPYQSRARAGIDQSGTGLPSSQEVYTWRIEATLVNDIKWKGMYQKSRTSWKNDGLQTVGTITLIR
jgi:PKD repeat protein